MIQKPETTRSSVAARKYIRAASEGDEATVPIRVQLTAAAASCKEGRFERAETIYRSVLQRRPGSYLASLNLGYLRRRRGDYAAALECFQTACAAKPHKRLPKLEAATELRRHSRMDEAESLYRAVLNQRPKQVRALVGLGRIAQARGEFRQAIAHYQSAAAADPVRVDLQLRIAAQLRKLWRIEEARNIYRAILLRQPDDEVARVRLRKLPSPRRSGLPPFERSWLQRDTFTCADTWSRNLEALGIPAFGVAVLTLAQDFACGASEEVKPDCILIRRDGKTKILPLVCDREAFGHVVEREAALLAPKALLGYVPESFTDGWAADVEIVESHHEFVYHRASAAEMAGPALSKYRQEVRRLLRAGAHVEPIGPDNLERVLACNDRWYAGKEQRGRKTYYRQRTLWTFENLSALEPLHPQHLAVVLDGDVIGYAVSSHIGSSWAIFIYRRCDRDPPGIAPYLLSEMCKLYPDRQWINDGPTVRKPGLAWFKDRFTANADSQQMTLGLIKRCNSPAR